MTSSQTPKHSTEKLYDRHLIKIVRQGHERLGGRILIQPRLLGPTAGCLGTSKGQGPSEACWAVSRAAATPLWGPRLGSRGAPSVGWFGLLSIHGITWSPPRRNAKPLAAQNAATPTQSRYAWNHVVTSQQQHDSLDDQMCHPSHAIPLPSIGHVKSAQCSA